jgi:hypothetical protein
MTPAFLNIQAEVLDLNHDLMRRWRQMTPNLNIRPTELTAPVGEQLACQLMMDIAYPARRNANVIRSRIEQSIKAMDDVDRQVFGYRRIRKRPGRGLQFTRRV